VKSAWARSPEGDQPSQQASQPVRGRGIIVPDPPLFPAAGCERREERTRRCRRCRRCRRRRRRRRWRIVIYGRKSARFSAEAIFLPAQKAMKKS